MSNLPPLASIPLPSPPAPSDQLKANVQAVFNLLLPFLAYMVPWEYRVVSATPSVTSPLVTVDLVAVDIVRCPIPELNAIPLWPGPSGAVATPLPGTLATVQFSDGNPAKPKVVSLDASATPATVRAYAASVVLGSVAATPVALATPLASLIASAAAAASAAAVPGDGGKTAFGVFASAMAAGTYAALLTKAT